ncbi:MAG: TIGR00725 family protein [Thermodesulfobacteriota bacterium]|nr:MAG: TIGR00725 family protein [Thermodesulfobacteriota bacterium]
MKGKRYIIGVIGSGGEDPEFNRLAEEVGSVIASKGHVLVNGGLGGVMEASARGARKNNGLTIGILPSTDASAANPHVEIPLPTGLGEGRNLLIIRAASGLVAVGGGFGTLSEIAFALKLKKPVAGLKTWDVSEDIMEASSPAEAVEKVIKAIEELDKTG